MAAFEGGPAAAPLLVAVKGFVSQRVHHRPGDVGMAGGVGAGRAVGDLAADGGAAFDGQEAAAMSFQLASHSIRRPWMVSWALSTSVFLVSKL